MAAKLVLVWAMGLAMVALAQVCQQQYTIRFSPFYLS